MMDDAYVVVYSGDGMEELSYVKRADLLAAVEDYAEARSEMDDRNDRGHYHRIEGAQEWHGQKRARVHELLGMEPES